MPAPSLSAPAVVRSLEVPALIAGSVNLMRFAEALARAGLIGRHDPQRGVLVIEPVPQSVKAAIPADAEVGMAWHNRLSKAERLRWHRLAGSAVPADAWAAFQGGAPR
jgi:hypothetical protein